MNYLKGRIYEMLGVDGSVMQRFKISHVKEEVKPSITHEDGSVSSPTKSVYVSDNGSGWYKLYGGKTDRII